MNIAEITEEALRISLQSVFLSARVRKFPKCYAGAPARRKAGGARARKLALYASMTGIRKIRIRAPNSYTRLAE
jgi:hypothetical protein